MKALIVDDERHVIDAILLLVPWQEFGITETLTASTVPDACDILEREKPQIAIVDVVIGDRLGIEILSFINSKQLPTKSLVVSGYDNYQYIRAMFVLDAVDYLLKPIVPEQIVAAVEKLANLVMEKEKKNNENDFGVDLHIKHLFPNQQHALFRKLFQKDLRNVAYKELCQINLQAREAKTCLVLHGAGLFLPISDENYVISLSSFLNNLQRELEMANYGTLFQKIEPAPDVVILLYNNFEPALECIRRACLAFTRKTGINFYLGCSGYQPFAAGIDEAWNQACIASDSIEESSDDLIRVFDAAMVHSHNPSYREERNKVFSALLVGDRKKIETCMNEWIQRMLGAGSCSRGDLRRLWEEFLGAYEQWCKYFSVQNRNVTYMTFSSLYYADHEKTIGELKGFIPDKLWGIYLDWQDSKDGYDWIHHVTDYMEMNYDQKFRQQEYADMFHLNKSYMCRKFKEAYGIGMVDYMNKIRIREAKILLANTDLQIQKIADRVGYFDNKYFSLQFKKETGKTPAEYRTEHT